MSFHSSPRYGLVCAALLFVAAARGDDKPAPPDKDHAEKMARGAQLFKDKVRPVFVARCLKCHGGKTVETEFDMADRPQLLKGGLGGPAVVPGKHRDSLLFKLVAHSKEPHMPWQTKKL